MVFVLIWLGFGFVSSMIAERKGNNGCSWFIIGVLLGPIGLLMSYFTSDNEHEINIRKGNTRKCPYCAEYVKFDALVCKHCHNRLN